MKQSKLITWLGGRKYIIAQEIIWLSVVTAITGTLTPTLAGILAGVGLAYGAFNAGSKFAIAKKETNEETTKDD